MSKHTPGPWEYEPTGQTVYGISEGGCNKIVETFMVANIRGWGHLQYLPNGAEIQDANGRLIAAAPDLLAACLAAKEWLDGWASAEPQLRVIENAIAKAKGETP